MEVHGCSDVGPLIDTDCGLSLLPWSWGRFLGPPSEHPRISIFQTRPLLWAHELRQRCAEQRRRSGTVPAWVYSGAIVAGAVPGHGPAQEKWPAKQIAFWLVVPV